MKFYRFYAVTPLVIVSTVGCTGVLRVKLHEPRREKLPLYNIIVRQTFSFVVFTVLHVKSPFVSRVVRQMLLRFFRVGFGGCSRWGGGLE